MKKLRFCFLSLFFSVLMIFTCFATTKSITTPITEKDIHLRGWVLDSTGWRYYLYNNQFYKSEWRWLNSSEAHQAYCYLFGDNGYIYTNCVTPDGYYVNANGEWYDPLTGISYTKKSNEIYTSLMTGPADGITQTQGTQIINTTNQTITASGNASSSRHLRNNIQEMQGVSIVDKLELNGTTYKNLICFESNGAWLTCNMGKYTRLKLQLAIKDSYIDDTYYNLAVYVNDEEVDSIDFAPEKYESYAEAVQEYDLKVEENDVVMLYFTYNQTNKWLKKKLYITSGILQK